MGAQSNGTSQTPGSSRKRKPDSSPSMAEMGKQSLPYASATPSPVKKPKVKAIDGTPTEKRLRRSVLFRCLAPTRADPA